MCVSACETMGESSRITVRLCVGFAAFSLAACASKVEKLDGGGFEDAQQPETPPCDPMLPKFTVGMNGLTAHDSTGQIKVRIDDASSLVPQRNYNTWRIVVEDANGQPNPNAKLNWACAWMAVHGHGSNPQAVNDLGPGTFELFKQNLSMYGPWAVELWVDPTGAGPNYSPQTGAKVMAGDNCIPSNDAAPSPNVTFDFCVPEGGS